MPKTKIILANSFEREYARLRKRYPSLKADIASVIQILREKPDLGRSLGRGMFKVRLAIKSKSKGKRGGGRIITYFLSTEGVLYLLTIYDKSERTTISDHEINSLLIAALEENPV